MQQKKKFESTLDESVAAGLNAGIEVLMNQVRILANLVSPCISTDLTWSLLLSGGTHHSNGNYTRPVLSSGWARS
jgi:hypothetical protein